MIRPSHSRQASCKHPVCCILLADDSTHLADGLHTADQVLHSHIQIPPKSKVVLGWGRRIVVSPLVAKETFAGLFTDNGTHFANGLHTTDQVLLHSHNCFPPELSLLLSI